MAGEALHALHERVRICSEDEVAQLRLQVHNRKHRAT